MDPNNNKKIQRDAPARQAVDSTTSWRFAEAPDPIEFAQTVLGVADVGVLRDGDGRITRAWVDHVEVDRRELQRIARARVAEAERLGDPRRSLARAAGFGSRRLATHLAPDCAPVSPHAPSASSRPPRPSHRSCEPGRSRRRPATANTRN